MSGVSAETGERIKTIASYLGIYVIWGSTYLAISISIRTLPIFFSSAVRFLTAGSILIIYSLARKVDRPSKANLIIAVKSGFISFFISYGLLMWAEQILPSSVAALIVSIEPAWFVLFDWIFFRGPRPNLKIAAGQVIGFAGCAVLMFGGGIPDSLREVSEGRYVVSAIAVILSGFAWVYGVLLSSKSGDSHKDSAMASGLQMFFGGIFFILASAARWEFADVGGGTAESWIATLYLIIFGSIVAYSGYVYLLRREPASRVTTHTFVNPVVAVALGWAIAGEEITGYTLLSAALVVVSVIIIIYSGASGAKH
jgi:drug/metabolite transporter (DMT)-like permease